MSALHVTADILLGLLACAVPEHWMGVRHAIGTICAANARAWWVAEQRLIAGGRP